MWKTGSTEMFDCSREYTLPFINKPPIIQLVIERHDTNSNQTDCNNILLPSDVNQYLSEAIELHMLYGNNKPM